MKSRRKVTQRFGVSLAEEDLMIHWLSKPALPKWNVVRVNLSHHIKLPIKCPTTGTGDGYPSGSVELNPFWLGEAKTGHFDEGTSSRDFARDRRSFRRRRRSGCYISCGRGLTTEASRDSVPHTVHRQRRSANAA